MSIWPEIKKALNTNFDKPLNILSQEIHDSLFHKMEEIYRNTGIKSIQFANVSVKYNTTVAINTINVSKTMVLLNTSSLVKVSSLSSGESNVGFHIKNISSTKITIELSSESYGGYVNGSLQIIEFY